MYTYMKQCYILDKPMASLSTGHLDPLVMAILLNLVKTHLNVFNSDAFFKYMERSKTKHHNVSLVKEHCRLGIRIFFFITDGDTLFKNIVYVQSSSICWHPD